MIDRALTPSHWALFEEVKRPRFDLFEDAGGGESFMASAFGLFFQRTSAAKNYRAAVLVEWLKAAGFASFWTVPLRSSGGTHALIVGRK